MLNIRNPKEHLDEMQVQTRNKVGNQCFFMMFFLLMINLYLQNHGVKWAASSMSVYAIITLCMGYYLTRIVLAGAYVSSLTKSTKHVYLVVGLLAATTAVLSILAIIKNKFINGSFIISYSGVLRLFIFSFVFVLIILVFSTISRRKNNQGND